MAWVCGRSSSRRIEEQLETGFRSTFKGLYGDSQKCVKAFERDWILHKSSKDGTREVAQWTPEPVGGHFPSSRMQYWHRHTQQLAKYPHSFSDPWSEGYYGKKGQM